MIKGYIYGLADPGTKEIRYIGRSIQGLHTRLQQHIKETNQVQANSWKPTYKNNWILSLQQNNAVPEIILLKIVYSSTDKLTELIAEEEKTIHEYQKNGRITNTLDSGSGWTSEQLKALWADPDWRAQQQKRMSEVYATQEYKDNLHAGKKRLWANPEFRTTMLAKLNDAYVKPEVKELRVARLREARQTEASRLNTKEASKKSWAETREKRIAGLKKASATPEGREIRNRCIQKANAAKRKKIRCLETNQEFSSIIEASRQMNVSNSALQNHMRGYTNRVRSPTGYLRFSYASD
jgi:hypothetical protein